jgi:hypothetical protein
MAELSRRGLIVAVGGGAVAVVGLGHPFGPGGLALVRRHRTSFGAVSLLGSERIATRGGGAHHAARVSHAPARGADLPVTSRVHGAWHDAVVVDLAVANERTSRLAFSPGQFRLRVDRTGPTVSLYSADRDAGLLAPGSTTMRITYLAPPPGRELSLEFDDAEGDATVTLGPVGTSSGRPARS